ncbi:MAG: thiamine pyrophosphate-dependent enzyme [Candidatus Nanoarchaeia archaeon]|nr:thiamine pyrophosphate-dependent enzyme [Candidatus Nanoarchaeia archaeon]
MNFNEFVKSPSAIASGHRLCAGCGAAVVGKLVTKALGENIVVANATGCLEVATTIYPYSAWKVPFIHNAFENAAATISGVESAYNSLKKQGKIKKDIKFVAFGGDGGTYDIGLQSLSGALERGHNFIYILYDNEAYMNTGIQRSSSTPFGANTTTSPSGSVIPGKIKNKKPITEIIAAHKIPYVAQASPSHYMDLIKKIEKAKSIEGPAFINIISPCVLGWKYPADKTIEMARLAVESNVWPLYEVIDGEKWILNNEPKNPIPVIDYLKEQGRFKHLFKKENKDMLKKIQDEVNHNFEMLKKKSEFSKDF